MAALGQKQTCAMQNLMSAKGQKQTCAPQNVVSALPPKATLLLNTNSRQLVRGRNVRKYLYWAKGTKFFATDLTRRCRFLGGEAPMTVQTGHRSDFEPGQLPLYGAAAFVLLVYAWTLVH